MCCESAKNTITNNLFATKTQREAIAVDGSAYNLIENNHFINPFLGGIFLYRNSGEGGTIRHQSPQHNKIINNYFDYSKNGLLFRLLRWFIFPTIWVGSRSGLMKYFYIYRNDDKGYPFGSSINDEDFAYNNIIKSNKPTKDVYIKNSNKR